MAENINSTQALNPTMPVKPINKDKEQQDKGQNSKQKQHDKEQQKDPTKREHDSLFDEFV